MLTQPSYYLSLYIREFWNLLISVTDSSLREFSKDIKRILKDLEGSLYIYISLTLLIG